MKDTEIIQGASGARYQYIDTSPPKHADAVNSPAHYTVGGIEVIDFIEAKGLNYNLGNAIKYISRALYKGKKEEDIAKAIWYLQREIK
jgi:hypothetical protein